MTTLTSYTLNLLGAPYNTQEKLQSICFSERIGWIPLASEVPENLVNEYKWVFGLSITEMEIVHGAYRKDNPNCRCIQFGGHL